MANAKIIYEPHPVSAERKAELVGQGYKIIDAQFAPEGVAEATEVAAKPVALKAAAKKAEA